MKCRMAMTALAATAALAACSPASDGAGEAGTPTVEDWTVPPRIESVTPGRVLAVRGRAAPDARVVVRGPDGAAFAASADADGRFDIRMAPPEAEMLILTAEVQEGQDAYPSPQRLLLLDGGRGPVALLTSGGATRRLDAAPALAAVDSDGRLMILSGTAGPDAEVRVVVPGRGASLVRAGSDGRWSLTAPAAGATRIEVDGAGFDYPGPRGTEGAGRAGAGWAVGWTAADGARQSTWLPGA